MSQRTGSGCLGFVSLLVTAAGVFIAWVAYINPPQQKTPPPPPPRTYELRVNVAPNMVFRVANDADFPGPNGGMLKVKSTEQIYVVGVTSGVYQLAWTTSQVSVFPLTPETSDLQQLMSGSTLHFSIDSDYEIVQPATYSHSNPSVMANPNLRFLMDQQAGSLGFASAGYPGHPVRVGDTWDGSAVMPLAPNAYLNMQITTQLESVRDSDAALSYRGTITGVATGTITGQALIDMSVGFPRRQEIVMDAAIVDAQGQRTPFNMSIRQEFSRMQ